MPEQLSMLPEGFGVMRDEAKGCEVLVKISIVCPAESDERELVANIQVGGGSAGGMFAAETVHLLTDTVPESLLRRIRASLHQAWDVVDQGPFDDEV